MVEILFCIYILNYFTVRVILVAMWRLAGGRFSNEGRVELFRHGIWGTICHSFWILQDAKVACRSMGLPAPAYFTRIYQWFPRFGRFHGKSWMINFQCFGNERTLEECPHAGYGNVPLSCDYPYYIAGTVCGHQTG